MDRIRQQYAVSKEHTEQPSNIDVSIVTVVPIFVVFAAEYIIRIIVLLIERCAHRIVLKYWPHGIGRRQ